MDGLKERYLLSFETKQLVKQSRNEKLKKQLEIKRRKSWIKFNINTKTGRLNKTKIMKDKIQTEHNMQHNRATRENLKLDKKWFTGNGEKQKKKTEADELISTTEKRQAVSNKEVNTTSNITTNTLINKTNGRSNMSRK